MSKYVLDQNEAGSGTKHQIPEHAHSVETRCPDLYLSALCGSCDTGSMGLRFRHTKHYSLLKENVSDH